MIKTTAHILLLCFLSASMMGQADDDLLQKMKNELREKGELSVWQLKFRGSNENGHEFVLDLGYGLKHAQAILTNELGQLRFFEGLKSGDSLSLVEYGEDIIRGYFSGRISSGIISGTWTNASRSSGQHYRFYQVDRPEVTGFPELGALLLLKGHLNGVPSQLLIDWHSDGRIYILLHQGNAGIPTEFRDDNFHPIADEWIFADRTSGSRLKLEAPFNAQSIELSFEENPLTVSFGRFYPTLQLDRVAGAENPSGPGQFEILKAGKHSLDKRIRSWSEDWVAQRGRDKNQVQSWFELTGYAEDLIFGRWWVDDGVDSIIAFKAVVIDLQAERIFGTEEVFEGSFFTLKPGEEVVYQAGKLCVEGPQHRIYGRQIACERFGNEKMPVKKKYLSRFTNDE